MIAPMAVHPPATIPLDVAGRSTCCGARPGIVAASGMLLVGLAMPGHRTLSCRLKFRGEATCALEHLRCTVIDWLSLGLAQAPHENVLHPDPIYRQSESILCPCQSRNTHCRLQKTRILGLEDRSTLLIRSFGQCGDCFPIGGSKLPPIPWRMASAASVVSAAAAAAARRVV